MAEIDVKLMLEERRNNIRRLRIVGKNISKAQGMEPVRSNANVALRLDAAFLLCCEMLSELTGEDYAKLKETL